MYKEIFPERIKKARIDAGYTQPQVSDELHISKGTISKYETGKLEPDLEKLATLADFYCVSIDWLLGIGQKEPTPKPKTKFSDKLMSAVSVYAFLATLSMQDKKIFLSGQMKFSQFTESKFFYNLTSEQKLFLYQEYQKQHWDEIENEQ